MGRNAGLNATNAFYSNFFGNSAGGNAASANNSNFLGRNAGCNANASCESIFIGNNTGNNSCNSCASVFIGSFANENIFNSQRAIAIGACSRASSCGVALGWGATVTTNNLAFGSTNAPLQVAPGQTLSTSLSSLFTIVNGVCFRIPLLAP